MLNSEQRLLRLLALARAAAALWKNISFAMTTIATALGLVSATLASVADSWGQVLAACALYAISALRALDGVAHWDARAGSAASVVRQLYALRQRQAVAPLPPAELVEAERIVLELCPGWLQRKLREERFVSADILATPDAAMSRVGTAADVVTVLEATPAAPNTPRGEEV
jgi:hypothetical protein